MKNILLYTDTPQNGGAELQMLLLAKFLDRKKFNPIVVGSHYPTLEKWFLNLEKNEIPIYKLPVKSKHDPKHYLYLKKLIKEKDIDLLHLHVWNPASCRLAFLAGNHCKIPIITTEHDPFKLSFFKKLIRQFLQKKVQKIVTVSEENKKLLTTIDPQNAQKIAVIHNGIDTTWWQSQILSFQNKDRKEIKEKIFHAKEDSLIITTISTLHPRKGLKTLIHAAKAVVEKYSNVKFVIVGQGPQEKELKSLINKLQLERNVALTGQQNNIPYILKSSDIFVLPSNREAFGFVNLEAMISKLPVIATKVGGIPEIIQDQKNGILIKPQSPQEMSQAIIKLIENPNLRSQLSTTGHKTVVENFNAQSMSKKYQEVYTEVIHKFNTSS